MIAIIKRYRTNEGLLIQELQELKNEINKIKESLNQMKKAINHMKEWRTELQLLKNALQSKNNTPEENVERRDFHAIHRFKDQKTMIAKLINCRDSTNILKKKKKL